MCVICLSTNNRKPSQIYCENNHIFHVECCENLYTGSCPICRERLLPTNKPNLRTSKARIESKLNCRLKCIRNESEFMKIIRPVLKQCEKEEEYLKRFLHVCELYNIFTHYNEVLNIYGKLYDWVLKRLVQDCSIIITFHPATDEFVYATKMREELRSMHPIEIIN